jgi:23S rRNA (adenine2503-C2)-methyltransferase
MTDLLSMSLKETELFTRGLGEPAYRAKQLFSAVHANKGFSALPKALREALDFPRPELVKQQVSADGTAKLLYRLHDGELIESVLLTYGKETAICVSTQAGCGQGCAFCASARGGKSRDLTAGEMLGQVIYCGREVKSVVLMGMGEPLDNYCNTLRFIGLLREGQGMSPRRVTLSTCGLAPEIVRLSRLGLPLTLSVSLHAPDDETRSMLMPINKKYGVNELIDSAEIYFDKTGRRNTYEYVMIHGVNDSPSQARALCALLSQQRAHVNLIRYNPVPGVPFAASRPEAIKAFAAVLSEGGVNVTIRRRLGADIDAACGQLRRGTKHTKGDMA